MMYLGDELTGRHVQVPGLQAPRDITPTPRTAPWKHGSMTAASNNDRHLSGGGMVRNREIARGGAWEGRSVSGQLVSGCTVWSKKFDDGSLNTKQNTLRHVSWPSTSKVAWRHAVGENCTRRNIGAYEDAPAPRLASRPSFPFSGRHVKPAPPWRGTRDMTGRQLSSHSRRLFAGSAQRHTKKKGNGLSHLRLVTHLSLRDSPLWKGGQVGKVGSPQNRCPNIAGFHLQHLCSHDVPRFSLATCVQVVFRSIPSQPLELKPNEGIRPIYL